MTAPGQGHVQHRRQRIPLVFLKTRSEPNDNYEDYFSGPETTVTSSSSATEPLFHPMFVPVLEHRRNHEALDKLATLLSTNQLKTKYGGMIFTSQRAVEGWADVVTKVKQEHRSQQSSSRNTSSFSHPEQNPDPSNEATDSRSNESFTTDIQETTPFPLYTVGPATAKSLHQLLLHHDGQQQPPSSLNPHPSQSPFHALNPTIQGSHTGNGATLAKFIQQDYHSIQAHKIFSHYEAPRLPFIPLLGMGSQNYSRKRLEISHPAFRSQPLLFLVGEIRRDIIPKTLMDPTLPDQERIDVHEVEVYSTSVRDQFQHNLEFTLDHLCSSYGPTNQPEISVMVVFSPQGAIDMLRAIGFLQKNNNDLNRHVIEDRWSGSGSGSYVGTRYVVVTIGPTTREFLVRQVGFEPDVVASSPSPKGVGDGVVRFLTEKGFL